MTMCATVLAVQDGTLLVRNCRTRQPVLVRTRGTSCFRPGDRARITFDCASPAGFQVTARHVCRLCR